MPSHSIEIIKLEEKNTELQAQTEALHGYASRLRDLSQRLREVEESERRAISRELHDRIGQDLATLGLILGSLSAKLSQESVRAVHKPLQDMQGLLKSMAANVRDVMADLRPPVLDDYGLLTALRQLAAMPDLNGIEAARVIHLRCPTVPLLSNDAQY